MIMMMRTAVIKWMIARNDDLRERRRKDRNAEDRGGERGKKERVCKCDGCQWWAGVRVTQSLVHHLNHLPSPSLFFLILLLLLPFPVFVHWYKHAHKCMRKIVCLTQSVSQEEGRNLPFLQSSLFHLWGCMQLVTCFISSMLSSKENLEMSWWISQKMNYSFTCRFFSSNKQRRGREREKIPLFISFPLFIVLFCQCEKEELVVGFLDEDLMSRWTKECSPTDFYLVSLSIPPFPVPQISSVPLSHSSPFSFVFLLFLRERNYRGYVK